MGTANNALEQDEHTRIPTRQADFVSGFTSAHDRVSNLCLEVFSPDQPSGLTYVVMNDNLHGQVRSR